MDNSSVVALSRGRSLFRELNSIANNIANASVTGYRSEKVVFTEYVQALEGQEESLSVARAGAHYINLDQGTLAHTGSDLDLAIEGNGFFVVEDPDGNQQLTRAGAFTLNPEGEIVTQEGFLVVGEGGGAITVPQGSGELAVASDGTVSANGIPFGKISIANANTENLQRAGDNLFNVLNGELVPAEEASVAQGFLEASNVNSVQEIARLIEVQRAYETIQNLNRDADDRIQNLLNAINRDS